jgi:hypothetical protein
VVVSLLWLRAGILTCNIPRKAQSQQIVLRNRMCGCSH